MARNPLPRDRGLLARIAAELQEYLQRLDEGTEACSKICLRMMGWRCSDEYRIWPGPEPEDPANFIPPAATQERTRWVIDTMIEGQGEDNLALIEVIKRSANAVPHLSVHYLDASWDHPESLIVSGDLVVHLDEARFNLDNWNRTHKAARELLAEVLTMLGTPTLGLAPELVPRTMESAPKAPNRHEPSEGQSDDDRAVGMLSRWIKERRKFTMTELASALGVPRTQIYDRERFPHFWALKEAHGRSLPSGRKEDGRLEADYHEDWDAIDEELDRP